RVQRAAQGDALLQLPIIRGVQLAIQLRLASQNNLQQLSARSLQVAEQPNLLEDFPIEILRLIDDQGRSPAGVGAVDQILVQREQDLGLRATIAPQVEIVRHHVEELLHGQAGIENVGEIDLLRGQKVAQTLEHGGFASADLAG